jgi:hypothetical protein
MINKSHHVSQHRAIVDKQKPLYDEGVRYLAAEVPYESVFPDADGCPVFCTSKPANFG